MSWEASAWAVKQNVGTTTGKLVLVVLSIWADACGSLYWGQGDLWHQCEISEGTLRQRLNQLEENGLIVRFKMVRKDGGFTSDIIVLLHDQTARDYAAWLKQHSTVAERGGQHFPTVSRELALMYERPERRRAHRKRAASIKFADGIRKNCGTHPQLGEERESTLNQLSESSASKKEEGPPIGHAAQGEALRAACLAASRGEGDRVFVERGSPPFAAWTRALGKFGLEGPVWSKKLAPDPSRPGAMTNRSGAWLPSEWPPDRE
jgi:hypothetical protein